MIYQTKQERVFELIGLAREFYEAGCPSYLNYLSLAWRMMAEDTEGDES